MRRIVILLAAASLIAVACGQNAEPDPSTATTVATTLPPVTAESSTTATVQESTTSSTVPISVAVSLEPADAAAAEAIADVYTSALSGGQRGAAVLPAGLQTRLSQRQPQGADLALGGRLWAGSVLETPVAVATIGDADVVLLVGTDAGAWSVVGAKLESLGEPAWYGDEPLQVLVIGSDARPGGKVEGHRADSVHIINAIPATATASIVGLPRDSWVEVSYGADGGAVDGMDKLTHTMASRGPEFVVEAVTTLTDVEIDGYLLTGFLGFEELIDAFGGFTIDVPYRMNDIKSFSNFSPGVQEFDGADALAFSRNRRNAPGGDFGRSFNHGTVMTAVLTEMQERGHLEQVPSLLSILMEFVQSDLTPTQLLQLAATTFDLDPAEIENIVVPGTTGWRSGRNVVLLSDEAHEIFADIAEDGILELVEEN